MYEWHKLIQVLVDEIDANIKCKKSEALTLKSLADKLGYSEFHMTRKFKEISGLQFREYLRLRRLAFSLVEVRDTNRTFLQIAMDYGFSSHEAFTRAFKANFGINPNAYRVNPQPVVLRTKINTFDRYFLGLGEIGMVKSTQEVKIYFVTIPEHKFLHIQNYESDGYWDFWDKQDKIPGQDCDTITGLLDSVTKKLDEEDNYSGQIMGYLNCQNGLSVESYPTARVECYGVRVHSSFKEDEINPLQILDIPSGEYLVFEHGAFDYDQENLSVAKKMREAIDSFDYEGTGYTFDNSEGRIGYFYHAPNRFWKNIFPVKKV